MQIIREEYSNMTPCPRLFSYIGDRSPVFFDIETTGLSKEKTSLYLIGCGSYENDTFKTIFFFADTPSEEEELLIQFFKYIRQFDVLIHFNGTQFDLPYIVYKANKYNLDNPLDMMDSFDIYQTIKPLRTLLFPCSMRQKCIEDFMHIHRNDQYDGGQLIEVYKSFCQTGNTDDFDKLMMHNREDVLGMHRILPILEYMYIFDVQLDVISSMENEYTDYEGMSQHELIINCRFPMHLPYSFSSKNYGFFLKYSDTRDTMTFRIPLYEGEMKHFYADIKNYWYLPVENTIIHKSLADTIPKEYREKAKRENCYGMAVGKFVPSAEIKSVTPYRFNVNDKQCYLPYQEIDLNCYVNQILQRMLQS